jgi:tetratricopeptide (TPR) repeat protein
MYGEAHEDLAGLCRLFAGEGAPGEAERAAAHLTGCRPCWLLAARAIAVQKRSGSVFLDGALRSIADLHEMEQSRLEEWLEAHAAWADVRSLSTKKRRDKVRLTRTLHTLAFLELLMEEGGGGVPPAESEEFFYLALLVAAQLPSPAFSVKLKNDLCADCCAEIANARRRLAKWPAARDALQKGIQYVEKGKRDGVVEAKVLCVAGALEANLGNITEAGKLLRRATGLLDATSQTFLRSRTLAQLANLLVEADPVESLNIVEQCLALVPPGNPRLRVFAEGIKIECLLSLGEPQEALLRFHDLRPLYAQFREPFIQIRRRFTAARLLEHLGRTKKAARLLEEVIAADLEHGLIKNFFLDLAYLFGFFMRHEQVSNAISVCQRAKDELSILENEEEGSAPAREQMRLVWQNLEEGVRKGTIAGGATAVLRNYIKSHWNRLASDPPTFQK